jgi:hypothetical protein
MKTFFKSLAVALLFASCGEADTAVYKGASGDQTFVSFSSANYSLPVEINATGSLDVTVFSSSLSDQDRTFNVVRVDEESTADPATYNLPATVTIPAGSHQGILTITGQDEDLEESTVLVIRIEGLTDNPDFAFDSNKTTITVDQFCPIEDTMFVGEYLLQQTSGINPDDGVKVFDDQVITLSKPAGAPAGSVARTFSAVYLESLDIGQPASNVVFQLLCGKVAVNSGITTGLLCVQGGPTITLGPGTTPGLFDTSSDEEFYINMTEYETDGGCGYSPFQVTFKLTKQ